MIRKLVSPPFLIFVFATYISFFVNGGINILLPIFAVICGISIFSQTHRLSSYNCFIIIFAAIFILFGLINPHLRWSSFIYTLIFIVIAFSYVSSVTYSKMHISVYIKTIRFLIFLYFGGLLIQQACVVFGIPVFNQILDYSGSNEWKLSSFADEPSHTARILALLMFSYLQMYKKYNGKNYDIIRLFKHDKTEKNMWLCFLYTMVMIQSSTAYVFLAILVYILSGAKKKNAVFILILFGIGLYAVWDNELVQRSVKTFVATLSFNETLICEADNSAAHRIVPILIILKQLPLSGSAFFIGHGFDTAPAIVFKLFPGYTEEYLCGGGAIFQLWYESGFFVFASYLLLTLFLCVDKRHKFSFVFWFLLVFINSINTQITWLTIFILFTNKYYSHIRKV